MTLTVFIYIFIYNKLTFRKRILFLLAILFACSACQDKIWKLPLPILTVSNRLTADDRLSIMQTNRITLSFKESHSTVMVPEVIF